MYDDGRTTGARTYHWLGRVDGPNYNDDADISAIPPLVIPDANTTARSMSDDRAYEL